MTAERNGSVRDGFTLIEVVMAMVLLASVLVMLAGMTFATARRSVELETSGLRQAVMLQEVNRLSALAFDDLGAQAGCRSVVAGPGETFTACVTLTTLTTLSKNVQVVLTGRPGVRPDTVRFERAKPPSVSPLNCISNC